MKNTLAYDVFAMKSAAKDARILIGEIRREISLAQEKLSLEEKKWTAAPEKEKLFTEEKTGTAAPEKEKLSPEEEKGTARPGGDDSGTNRWNPQTEGRKGIYERTAENLRMLSRTCDGYEALVRNMEASANLYGMAEAAASEMITF